MHVSIKDISRECGVSVSTVSRALNGHQDINEETRSMILATAKRMNYIPNNSARNLARQPDKSIAIIARGADNIFFGEMIRPFELYFNKMGYSTFLHHIDSGDNEILEAAKVVYEKRLSGIIFLGGQYNYSPQDLELLRVPFVFVTYTNYFGSLDTSKYSSVSIDDVEEAYRAVEYLIRNNHRKIAIVLPHDDDHSISQLRLEGYKKALSHYNLMNSYIVKVSGSFSLKDNYKAAYELVKEHELDAIFAISDTIAIATMKAVSDAGLRIPEDISVLGIDGIEMSDYCIPTLTTLKQPMDEIVENSTKILLDMIEKKGKNMQVLLKTNICKGNSVITR